MPISDSLPTPVKNAIAQAYRSVDDKLARMAAAAESADHSRRTIPRAQDYDEDDGPQSTTGRIIQGFRDQLRRGNPVDLDLESINAIVDVLQNKTAIDDRKFLLENLLTFMARISPKSKTAEMLQERVIRLLYLDLPHPPLTAVGNQYAFRSADGSGNNIWLPDLGKAGTPYVRSVQQVHPLPINELPDPDLIWETLMKRDKTVDHPSGLSSCFFAFANTVIHTCFNTNPRDYNQNQTSSYVDLSSLYGNNIDEQHAVRDMIGYGQLYPDTWSDVRLGLASPASSALLVLFNRNHNYIAQRLLSINERGTWSNPPPTDEKLKQKQDDEIFNTARLVNCGFYVSIVLGDYLSAILGLVREGSSFSLDLMKEVREDNHDFIRRGEGNANSVEFNLLYRWHSPTSQHDIEWLEPMWKKLFNNKPFDKITPADFRTGVTPMFIKAINTPPKERTFDGLKRGPDGRFNDDELARIIMDATESAAGMFKARGVPEVLRIIEIMGIEAGRKWGACSLNEFRKFLGLKPYKEFIEWNSDPEIAMAAEKLYETTDNLELHVGLVCEESKPVMPGAGLCPSYTTSRAILADACALTRGDRHLTVDYTPYNLTAWGFCYAARDITNASFGGMLGTLFQNTLPDHFPAESVYTQFPLLTPKAMQKFMTDLGYGDRYTYVRPLKAPAKLSARDGVDVKAVLGNGSMWKTPYVDNARMVMKGEGLLMWLNDPVKFAREKSLVEGVVLGGVSGGISGSVSKTGISGEAVERAKKYYYEKTAEFLKERSYTLSRSKTRSVDIVRDVLMAVPLHWASYELAGLPLKSPQDPRGSLYEEELYDMLKDIYNFVFLDLESAKRNVNAEEAETHVEVLTAHIKNSLRSGGARGIVSTIYETIVGRRKDAMSVLMRSFYATGKDDDELANDILSVVVGITTEYSQALTNVLNFYLEPENEYYFRDICQLARSNSPDAALVLEGYVREALRVDPPITRVTRKAAIPGSSGNFSNVDRGDIVFLNLAALTDAQPPAAASTGASASTSSSKPKYTIDPHRPKTAYPTQPLIYTGLSEDFLYKTMAQVLRAVFSLNNVRRGPGKSGLLKRHKETTNGIDQWMYLDQKHRPVPWAKSMTLLFDQ